VDREKPTGSPRARQDESSRNIDELLARADQAQNQPKAGVEAIAAALQAIQQLAHEVDSEHAAEGVSASAAESKPRVCRNCGAQIRPNHKFCATCGVSIDATRSSQPAAPATQPPAQEDSNSDPSGQHHYHHHYHHHFFPAAEGVQPSAGMDARLPAPPAAGRDVPRLRAPLGASGPSLSRAEAAVRKLTQDLALACNTKHLDDLVDLYGSDAILLRPNVPPVRGTAAIREFFVVALDAGLGEVEMEPLRTEIYGEIAYEAGRYKMLVPAAMGKRREERGKYLMVAQRHSSGDWKCLTDCFASDLSLAIGVEGSAKPAAPPARKP
jgi:ketosteroid isomerase-like protein